MLCWATMGLYNTLSLQWLMLFLWYFGFFPFCSGSPPPPPAAKRIIVSTDLTGLQSPVYCRRFHVAYVCLLASDVGAPRWTSCFALEAESLLQVFVSDACRGMIQVIQGCEIRLRVFFVILTVARSVVVTFFNGVYPCSIPSPCRSKICGRARSHIFVLVSDYATAFLATGPQTVVQSACSVCKLSCILADRISIC